MTRLTPKAEELVQAGREALRPNDADRQRVFQALLPQLGGGLAAGGGAGAAGLNAPSTAPVAPAAASGVAAKVVTAVVVIGVAGGGLFLALKSEPPPARPAATSGAPTLLAPPPPVDKAPESAPSAVPRVEPSEKRAPAASSRPADSLAEEVGILSQASAALHAGRPADALKMLEEHRRKFPRGALGQERTSARIQALCALGRTKEAQSELARLARSSPSSPHVARARKACGVEPAPTEKK